MAKTANIHVRMDESLKNDAIRVFNELGVGVAEAITMYFKQVALKKAIPFELNTEAVPRKNFDKISDLKKEDLQSVIDVLPESIEELWVFGSAVTPYCRPDSDLDICVVGDNISREDRKIIAHAPRRGMDLLDITSSEFEKESSDKNSVYYNVKNKGLLIYKKGEGLVNG